MSTTPSDRTNPRAPRGGLDLARRLSTASVKSRLIGMVSIVAALWLVSVLVAAIGLLSAKSTATGGNKSFPAYETERDAYEGWLTQDDQSNMAAALASLHEASQQKLLNQTLGEIEEGHTQALGALSKLARIAPTAAEKAATRRTISDLAVYSGFTEKVKQAIAAGETTRAIHLVTVENAEASGKAQEDFNELGETLSAGVRRAQASMASFRSTARC